MQLVLLWLVFSFVHVFVVVVFAANTLVSGVLIGSLMDVVLEGIFLGVHLIVGALAFGISLSVVVVGVFRWVLSLLMFLWLVFS